MTDERAASSRVRNLRVRTIFLGSGRFGLPALERLARHPSIDLVAVVTAPPRPAGRKGESTETWIARAAPSGVSILTPARLRAADSLEAIAALAPEFAVLVDYGQIVPAPILELPFGALNLHPSLLPRHRGATPIPATILAGDAETGVTLFRMDDGLDTGPIIATRHARLDGTDTGPSLHARLSLMAADLLDATIEPWLRGALPPEPQSGEGASLTRPLRREDGRLDPSRTATSLDRMVRAYDPWPGTFLETDTGRLAVWRSRPVEADVAETPGRIVPYGDGIALTTADRRLELLDVQPAGGRRMTGAALRRGRPAIVGSAVVPGP